MASAGGGAVDSFLKITFKKAGLIKGESKAKDHEGEIDVLAWSFGVSRPLDAGSGMASGRRSWTDFTFTKFVDSASTQLISAAVTNDEVKSADLVVRTVGENPVVTLKVTLSKAVIRSVSAGSAGGTSMSETVAISFRKIDIEYTPHSKERQKTGAFTANDELGAES